MWMNVPSSSLARMAPNVKIPKEVTSARVLVAGSLENTVMKVRCLVIAHFCYTQPLKFKTQLTFSVFAAVNHNWDDNQYTNKMIWNLQSQLTDITIWRVWSALLFIERFTSINDGRKTNVTADLKRVRTKWHVFEKNISLLSKRLRTIFATFWELLKHK